jgi:lipoate-protein ligase A
MQLFKIISGFQSGVYNMSLDEALLEAVRLQQEPVLILRTYLWHEPTLSLGVNQKVRDIRFLMDFYGHQQREPGLGAPQPKQRVQALVRRPTGGRAILHGQDISFAFITNDVPVLQQSLKASYELYSAIVRQALSQLSLPVELAQEAGDKDYTRSPVCFETHTPSDLVSNNGQKLAGSAQLRRAGGLLQHGSAFLKPFGITAEQFDAAFFQAAETTFGQPVVQYPSEALVAIEPMRRELEQRYISDSGGILANASTIKGSHLDSASF